LKKKNNNSATIFEVQVCYNLKNKNKNKIRNILSSVNNRLTVTGLQSSTTIRIKLLLIPEQSNHHTFRTVSLHTCPAKLTAVPVCRFLTVRLTANRCCHPHVIRLTASPTTIHPLSPIATPYLPETVPYADKPVRRTIFVHPSIIQSSYHT
jgi:hypothetical protein